MSKADKRNFRLYAKRIQSNDSMLFIQLFDILDKQKTLDEAKIIERLGNIAKGQLANIKRHLYKQILTSLRLIHINRQKSIEIREHLDFAHVLYSKGLYLQSLKILQRAKRMAEENDLELIVLEIIEFQKVIESRHITNTGPIKNEALVAEAKKRFERIQTSILLSNLRIKLHGYYIKNSHVKNEQERSEIIQYLEENLPPIDLSTLGYTDKIYLYQSYVWYYYILLDFEKCYEYALKWTNIFEENVELKMQDPDLFMRGMHYLLTAANNLQDLDKHELFLQKLQKFRKSNYVRFNENSKIFSFLYVHWARFDRYFLRGDFTNGVTIIPRSLRRIKRYNDRVAPHRIMLLYYKITWMYLGSGNPSKAMEYVSKIINQRGQDFREDIQIYSRLLYLMIHYDLDNIDLLPYLVKTVETFFNKIEGKNKLQSAAMKFFKNLSKSTISDRTNILKDFNDELDLLALNPYERRALIYLDIRSWVSAKLERKSIGDVISARQENHNRLIDMT